MITRIYSVLAACCLAWLFCASTQAQSTSALVTIGVGPAMGARTIEAPARQGTLRLSTGIHPALDFALSLGVQRERWSVTAAAEYRSSLGLRTENSYLSGDDGHAALRSHSLFAGVVPAYRYRVSGLQLRVSVGVGWQVRALRTVAMLEVPNYSLHGPALRPEVQLALLRDRITLGVSPELGVVVYESPELRELLGVRKLDLAVGAALTVDVGVTEGFHVVAGYRLAYAGRGTAWQGSFSDVEHFAFARAELRY